MVVKKYVGTITLAVGDGANDVGMIQVLITLLSLYLLQCTLIMLLFFSRYIICVLMFYHLGGMHCPGFLFQHLCATHCCPNTRQLSLYERQRINYLCSFKTTKHANCNENYVKHKLVSIYS